MPSEVGSDGITAAPVARAPLVIVSGSSKVRFAASINQRAYAEHIGVPYFFDLAPSAVADIYFQKPEAIRRFLPCTDWLFWIDDDAFFTDFTIDLRSFLTEAGDHDLVFCRSPVNPQGEWTWMNAGVLFVRNTPAMLEYLDAVLATDLEVVQAWWDPDVYGLFTDSDQDAMVYALAGPETRWRDSFLRLPWEAFNARQYHYAASLSEHFICHFTRDGRPKEDVIAAFADRLGTTPALCPPELFEPYRTFLESSEIGPILGIAPPASEPPAPFAPAAPEPGRRLSRAVSRLRRLRPGEGDR